MSVRNGGLAAGEGPRVAAVGGAGGFPGGAAEGLPPRSRGVIGLLEENCTVCMLCARECPDWCIYIESHTEPVPEVPTGEVSGHSAVGGPPAGETLAAGGRPGARPTRGRPRTRHVLDRFAIDFSLCMYCGICVEVCPYDALFWSPEYAYPEESIESLTHERDRLREWMWTVPPPPAHGPGAPTPREARAEHE